MSDCTLFFNGIFRKSGRRQEGIRPTGRFTSIETHKKGAKDARSIQPTVVFV